MNKPSNIATVRIEENRSRHELPPAIGLVIEEVVYAAWFPGGRKTFYRPAVLMPEMVGGDVVYKRRGSLIDEDFKAMPTVWGFETHEEARVIVERFLAGHGDLHMAGTRWGFNTESTQWEWIEPTMAEPADNDDATHGETMADRQLRRAEMGHCE